MRTIGALWLLGILPLAAQHGKIADPHAVELGQKQFANSCGACHGSEAQGGRGPNLREALASDDMKDEALYEIIQKGVKGGGMPGANLPEDQAWQLIAFLRSLTAPASQSHVPGDPAAGQELFWGAANCSKCHAVRGQGGSLGPDLTNIGALRSLVQLHDKILKPDDTPTAGYVSAVVTLKDGRTLRGVARNRTNYSLQLQDRDGNLHLLSNAQIREITIVKRSAMPGDYAKRLTPAQLENVLAYLSKQTIRPVETATAKK